MKTQKMQTNTNEMTNASQASTIFRCHKRNMKLGLKAKSNYVCEQYGSQLNSYSLPLRNDIASSTEMIRSTMKVNLPPGKHKAPSVQMNIIKKVKLSGPSLFESKSFLDVTYYDGVMRIER
mmetsp:Transcript_27052/g.32793  ORF Transcript_27052/g.32793 Transcript_27052/m.32793 type:complete len:121 (-) Transcript_27052:203-565(-)